MTKPLNAVTAQANSQQTPTPPGSTTSTPQPDVAEREFFTDLVEHYEQINDPQAPCRRLRVRNPPSTPLAAGN
ncbi:hypothetical protein O181_027283 [Austropuccinia psidii MF-1]|uniref:Uncharacterized protein n=1 Tax=Austropuccinia psidii MF-1 TaxID=1389203 RepID=A0A9Q3H0T2_9BASI|nr:hypothetical protein [Austropuccinia psidii MF-1]